MATELILLGWSVALLFLHIAVQGGASTASRGMWNAGPRDGDPPPACPIAGRAERALRNYLETWPAYIALALALAVTGRTGGLGETGALLWFAARVVYLPLYVLGVPYVRSLVWTAGAIGLLLMLARLI
jgi:uncharacterized MAPEG superfamily protein